MNLSKRWLLLLAALLVQASLAATYISRNDSQKQEALLSEIRQVTFEGRRSGEGYFGPHSSRLIFQSEREPENPFFQIYLLSLESGDTRRLSPGHGKTTCGWIHPDGERALFASTHHDPAAREKQKQEIEQRESETQRRYSWDFDPFFDLYQVNLQGEELTRLTRAHGYDAEGSYAPDGKSIVFASNRHAYQEQLTDDQSAHLETDPSYFMDLYQMNVDGSQVRRLTTTSGYDGGPFFDAAGERITWRRFSEDGTSAEIYTMDLEQGKEQQITRLGAMSWAPFFHPSGDYLIFATNLQGFSNFELYLVDTQGKSDPVRVTYTEGFDGLPAFSPDGDLLSWTSNRGAGDKSQIFFARWDDPLARKLLDLPGPRFTSREISAEDLRLHVQKLASEEMQGRMTATEGVRLALEYAAGYLKSLGLEPAGENETFFQTYDFTAGVSLGADNRLVLDTGGAGEKLELNQEWRPLALSRTGDFEAAPVVFAGYGLVVPESNSFPEYDSYAHLDVEGSWVMMLRFLPEDITAEQRQHLARYSSLRFKSMMARERGALGVIFVSGPSSQVKDELVDLVFDAGLEGTSLAAVSLSDGAASQLLKPAGKKLERLQSDLDDGEPAMGFVLEGVRLAARIDLEYQTKQGQNLLARLDGPGSSGSSVVVGAHIDHLGRGPSLSSLARLESQDSIHYGADDNASGVSGVLEIAEYFAAHPRPESLKKNLIFGLWTGEELGLLGATHYARNFKSSDVAVTSLQPEIAAYLNMDMIGRLRDRLILQGTGSSSVWAGMIEKRNLPVGLSISVQEDSYLPTDSTAFYLRGVPVLNAFTGGHEEYHTPEDTPEKLNYEGMERVVRLMTLITQDLVTSSQIPDYRQMQRPQDPGRAGLRVYLGTIPDYSQAGVQGVRLSGVVGGGPADQAGLKAEDVIVELAGRDIENIYDYTYAIDALKIGEEVEVVVEREGERRRLKIVPESRQ